MIPKKSQWKNTEFAESSMIHSNSEFSLADLEQKTEKDQKEKMTN